MRSSDHHPLVLVVDDDPRFARVVSHHLTRQGFRVDVAQNRSECNDHLSQRPIEVVLLDLHLPNDNGIAIARDIRAGSWVPIIFLTGEGDVSVRIAGLELGADDFITKPCNFRELAARIRTVLRRTLPPADADWESAATFENFALNPRARTLATVDGSTVPLTSQEFDLLRLFVQRAGAILNRDDLSRLIHNRPWHPEDRSLDLLVSQLRAKLGDSGRSPRVIKTVRGEGYVFVAQVRFDAS